MAHKRIFKNVGSRFPNVQYYESSSRRHNGRPDRCFYIRYTDTQGKRKREKIGWTSQGYTPQLSFKILAERFRSIHHGDELPNRRATYPTLSQLAKKYFDDREPTLKGASRDKNRWETHLERPLGDKTIDQIDPVDVERIRTTLQKKGAAPASVANVLELLRRIINYGAGLKLSPPLSFTIKLPKKTNLKTELLTPEQWERLLNVLDEFEDQASANMIRVALFGGLRRSEIFALRWDDLDFRNRVIHIRDPKPGEDETVPMNDLVLNVLTHHPRTDSPFVFPGRNGKQRVETRVAKTIRNRAGLPEDFRPFHGMRHAFASRLAESGQVDMYHLQKLLRHRSPQMTQRYAHLRNETLLNASNVLGSVLDSQSPNPDKKKKTK
jgi:integrase